MPVNVPPGQVLATTIVIPSSVNWIYAIGLVAAAVLYFIFSLIVLRQVSLMTETVETEGGSILKALALVHAFLALGVILILVGWLL